MEFRRVLFPISLAPGPVPQRDRSECVEKSPDLGESPETEERHESEWSWSSYPGSARNFAYRLDGVQRKASGRRGRGAPIGQGDFRSGRLLFCGRASGVVSDRNGDRISSPVPIRSEEHTSELQ